MQSEKKTKVYHSRKLLNSTFMWYYYAVQGGSNVRVCEEHFPVVFYYAARGGSADKTVQYGYLLNKQ